MEFAGITVNETHLLLQNYWWLIVGVLGALFVFMMWVQGAQTLLHVADNETEERLMLNSIGRKWELTFTSLVMFGGALYAAFPLFYSVSFGGAYWVWMLILMAFVLQAVAFEYMHKEGNLYGKGFYKFLLYFNGVVGSILIGAAVGTFFTGSGFSYDPASRLMSWDSPFRGLEAAFDFSHGAAFNLAFGLMLFFLVRTLGALYMINDIADDNLKAKLQKCSVRSTIALLPFLLYVLFYLVTANGYAYDPKTGVISLEAGKYLHNLMSFGFLPLIGLLVGLVLFLLGVFKAGIQGSRSGIWFSGLGTILVVLVVFSIAGFFNTVYYPSYSHLQSGLTIQNSSGSFYTLQTMAWVSIAVPFVLAYIVHAWYQMNKKGPITAEEINNSHAY